MSVFDSNGTSFKFVNEGDTVTGRVLSFREEQQHKFDRTTNKPSTELAVYDDGSPIMQVVFQLQTDLRDNEDDDGQRSVYISSGRAKKAVVGAVRAAGKKVPEEGGTLTVTYTGKDPGSFNASAKTFTASYEPPQAASQTFGTAQAPAPAQTVQQAQPVTQQPAQQAQAAAPAADEQTRKIQDLLNLNLPHDTISSALGVPTALVAAVASTMPVKA